VAVAGSAVSPPIDATLALLGRERTLGRIDAVLRSPPS
jgi:glutamyl-tRNA synthetase